MEKRILILDPQRINLKLQRMAYQIWEHNSHETDLTLVGIEGSGFAVAQHLSRLLREISPLKVEVLSIRMNKKDPLSEEIVLPEQLDDKSLVLVDDVANSGKTLLYALKPMLSSSPRRIMIAVLVDRKHKSFPVSPDIVGHTVATTLQEHIEVVCEDGEITGAYLK